MNRPTQNDRLSIILDVLQKKQAVSLDALANRCSVTKRTIRNDAALLNRTLRSAAQIDLNKGQCILQIHHEQHYRKIAAELSQQQAADTPEKRVKRLAAQLLDATQPLLIDDLSEQLHVSRSTLVSDLNHLRITFEPYDLEVKGKPNQGIHLQGSEWEKRLYILQNNDHVLDQPLDQTIAASVHAFAIRHLLAEATERVLLRYVGVVLARAAKHPLPRNSTAFDVTHMMQTKEYACIDQLASQLEKNDWVLSNAERAFLTIPILGRRSPVHLPNRSTVALPMAVRQLIIEIERQVKVQLSIDIHFGTISNELGYHLMFMLNRLVFGVTIHHSLIHEVQEKYPLACEIAQIADEVIQERYQIKVNEAELSYLAYYFGIALTENEEPLFQLSRVAIVCDTGRGSARIIAMQLNKILPSTVEKQLFSSLAVTKAELEQFDMIFSTVPLPNLNTAVIEVKDIFDERKLAQKINKYWALDTLKMKKNGQGVSLISQLLDEEHFFMLSNQKTHHDNMVAMITSLERGGLVDSGFKQRIMKREQVKHTLFDRGIAFPHTMNRASRQIVLAVGIYPLKQKVCEEEIRMIFLLGIPESQHNETLLIQLYEEMIALSKKIDLLHNDLSARTCAEMKKRVQRLCTIANA
ncbi:BglG family transcription antiterminator [Sporolactobacillus terrae]|uniref:BglG family transcription antiterminator n=1 Tax=Sporolactobacillus terrae TaxID=269673 RepID=UPI000686CDA7|nr:PRD domain-containing protein [Sporolactobacillus terrae]